MTSRLMSVTRARILAGYLAEKVNFGIGQRATTYLSQITVQVLLKFK